MLSRIRLIFFLKYNQRQPPFSFLVEPSSNNFKNTVYERCYVKTCLKVNYKCVKAQKIITEMTGLSLLQ